VKYNTNVWLLNTGYQKSGKRYPLSFSRSIVSFIKSFSTKTNIITKSLPLFNFEYIVEAEGLDSHLLDPELVWGEEYYHSVEQLYQQFKDNHKI
jgi:ATP-dependent phosphoenolpyruvate carboxykinase